MNEWLTAKSGKAHYVIEDGTSACAFDNGPRGVKIGYLMHREWKPFDPAYHHLCRLCQRRHARRCECGVCRIRPVSQRQGEGKP